MYIVLNINNFDFNNIYYQEKVKNTVMDNSNFLRVSYSNELFILNGVFIHFNLKLHTIEKSFNKYKCLFDINSQIDVISRLCDVETFIMNKYIISNETRNKTPIYRIKEQLNNGFLKLFNDVNLNNVNEFILKIYGIWETDIEYGLTYKFINI